MLSRDVRGDGKTSSGQLLQESCVTSRGFVVGKCRRLRMDCAAYRGRVLFSILSLLSEGRGDVDYLDSVVQGYLIGQDYLCYGRSLCLRAYRSWVVITVYTSVV